MVIEGAWGEHTGSNWFSKMTCHCRYLWALRGNGEIPSPNLEMMEIRFPSLWELHLKAIISMELTRGTQRRSNQSILKEISPGISLEGMMLKLKL